MTLPLDAEFPQDLMETPEGNAIGDQVNALLSRGVPAIAVVNHLVSGAVAIGMITGLDSGELIRCLHRHLDAAAMYKEARAAG